MSTTFATDTAGRPVWPYPASMPVTPFTDWHAKAYNIAVARHQRKPDTYVEHLARLERLLWTTAVEHLLGVEMGRPGIRLGHVAALHLWDEHYDAGRSPVEAVAWALDMDDVEAAALAYRAPGL